MVKEYHSVEGFENDCTTPCLVGSINPYEISKMLFRTGQTYRSTYDVDTTTLSEIVEESFTNGNDQVQQSTEDSLTLYDMESCYLDTYLNTNLQAYIVNDTTKYQLKILIDEVSDNATDSKLYRLRCTINKEGNTVDPKFFVLSDDNTSLQVSNEEYYITTTNTSITIASFGNTNTNNTQSNTDDRELNPNNTLYYHFYQVYTNAIYIKVFDEETSYGYLTKDMGLISETEIFDLTTYSGFNDNLLNVNYYFMKPYQLPDYVLDNYLDSNIKVTNDSGDYVETNIKIEEYYTNPAMLEFQYMLTIQKSGESDEKQHAFTQNVGTNKISTTDKCSSSTSTNIDGLVDKYLFTFWETLDGQFIVAKMFENNYGNNCYNSGSNTNNNNNNNITTISDTTSYDLVGVCSTAESPDSSCSGESKELYIVNRTTTGSFRNGVHCNISNSYFNIEDLDTLITVIELNAKSLLIEDIQTQNEIDVGDEVELETESCDDNRLHFVIIFKIISVIIAVFLFLDFDNTRELAVKIFKLVFTVIFSEFYVIYQIFKHIKFKT
jgi:hypothetical protein